MRWMTFLLSAALGVTALADQPLATFSGFNDWLGSETRGVRIGADGRLRLAPNLRRVGQLPEGVIWAAVPDGSGGAFLSAGTDGKLFHFSGGQVKPLGQVKGGIVFGGKLLTCLHFPLDFDYVHATRYNNTTQGSGLQWKVPPSISTASPDPSSAATPASSSSWSDATGRSPLFTFDARSRR